jgi:hypothetical protein
VRLDSKIRTWKQFVNISLWTSREHDEYTVGNLAQRLDTADCNLTCLLAMEVMKLNGEASG